MRMFVILMAATLIGLAPCEAADINRGHDLADRLCAVCHMNKGQGEKQGSMEIPGFQAIADRPNQTIDAIVHWLRSKPPMMPDHQLSLDEAHALADYIMSLRQPR